MDGDEEEREPLMEKSGAVTLQSNFQNNSAVVAGFAGTMLTQQANRPNQPLFDSLLNISIFLGLTMYILTLSI